MPISHIGLMPRMSSILSWRFSTLRGVLRDLTLDLADNIFPEAAWRPVRRPNRDRSWISSVLPFLPTQPAPKDDVTPGAQGS